MTFHLGLKCLPSLFIYLFLNDSCFTEQHWGHRPCGCKCYAVRLVKKASLFCQGKEFLSLLQETESEANEVRFRLPSQGQDRSQRVDQKKNPWRGESDEEEKVKDKAKLSDAGPSVCIHTSSHVEHFGRLTKWLTSQALGKTIMAAMVYF